MKPTNTSGSNITGVVSPALFTNAISLLSVRFAESVFAALDVVARRLALHPGRRSDVSGLALAVEAADGVLAAGVRSAGVGGALVDVHADGALGHEALATEALALDALGVVDAVEVGLAQDVDVHLFAGDVGTGLGRVALGAQTVVAGGSVFAHGVRAARPIVNLALIDICKLTRGFN